MKEGFFRNYELAQLSPLTRILFEGLWCLSDKNGRLWDRPIQIKAECLPYDECDIENMLAELAKSGFIQRYDNGDKKCIQVVNFEKHQSLTTWEKNTSADIPAPKGFKKTSKLLQTENKTTSDSITQNSNDQNSNEDAAKEPLPFSSEPFLSAWSDYQQARKEKRQKVTPTIRRALCKKMTGWGETRSIAALIHSTGYTGLFEPNGNGDRAHPNSANSGKLIV